MKHAGICLLFALILAAPGMRGAAQQEQFVEVRIAKGDTLRQICVTYLKDPDTWPEIARFNRMANPNLIFPGQVIRIPVRFSKSAPSEAKADFVRGKAEIKPPGGLEWKPLAPGDPVPQGSSVRTLAGSALEIVFENGDACFLRPETSLGLTSTARDGTTWIRKLLLQAGKVIARIQKATGTQTRFEISTPSAQCAARGTVFRVTADADDASRAEVLEGTVSVEAAGAAVSVAVGRGTAVRRGEAPLPPRALLAAPVPAGIESVYRSLPFAVNLSSAPGAVSVIAALTRDRDGRDPVAEAVLAPGRPFRITAAADGSYFLHLRSVDDLGLEGLASAPVEIRVRTEPAAPLLRGIAPGARLRCGTPPVHWAPVAGAERYELQIALDPAFGSIVDRVAAVSSPWAPAGLPVGSYHLRARSIASDGFEGGWSEGIGFSVLPPYPAPILEKPKRAGGRISLRWSDLGPGVVTRVHVAADPDFKALVHEELMPGTETLLLPPDRSGLYYVRVRGFDAEGCQSAYSNVQKFRVGGFWAFCKPCLLAPLAVLIYLLVR